MLLIGYKGHHFLNDIYFMASACPGLEVSIPVIHFSVLVLFSFLVVCNVHLANNSLLLLSCKVQTVIK